MKTAIQGATVSDDLAHRIIGVIERSAGWLPGLVLCIAIAVSVQALAAVEAQEFGRAWLEPLVLAILVGTVVRTAWSPGRIWSAGIQLSGNTFRHS